MDLPSVSRETGSPKGRILSLTCAWEPGVGSKGGSHEPHSSWAKDKAQGAARSSARRSESGSSSLPGSPGQPTPASTSVPCPAPWVGVAVGEWTTDLPRPVAVATRARASRSSPSSPGATRHHSSSFFRSPLSRDLPAFTLPLSSRSSSHCPIGGGSSLLPPEHSCRARSSLAALCARLLYTVANALRYAHCVSRETTDWVIRMETGCAVLV